MKIFVKLIVNQLSLKEIISWLRLNPKSWKRHCSLHHDWCLDPDDTKDFLRGFGTISQKYDIVICCIASCSMTTTLAGIRRFSPSLCWLQGISFPWAGSLPRPRSTRALNLRRTARTLLTQGKFPFAQKPVPLKVCFLLGKKSEAQQKHMHYKALRH